jgi:hypothetical protein
MSRANIYRYPTGYGQQHEPVLEGWFDPAKARQWSDTDYNGNGSGGTGRGQAVFRTSGGKWVLCNWTRWQDENGTFEYASDDEAREWLLRNHEDEAVAEFFGEMPEEEDRRSGRPAIGGAVHIRLGDLQEQVDAYAAERDLGRAGAVRALLAEALAASRPYAISYRDSATGLRETDPERYATLGAAVEALRQWQAEDRERQQERGLPSWSPQVERDGRPVDVEAVIP